jgi:aminocarboxymuconate-semialdehyde decarboxylase
MCRLMYAGYLERWPDLKIVVHHSGGTVPMIAGRLKTAQGPESEEAAAALSRPLLDYLKSFYADTANFGNPIALRAALEFFGPDHVLFGSDFGFSQTFAPSTIEDIETVVQDEDLKRTLYEGNAMRVLRLDEHARTAA